MEERKETRKLATYNTDWLGMKRPILRQLMRKGDNWREPGSFGVVAGAGGTARAACCAMKDLGLDIFVYNRSPDKGRNSRISLGVDTFQKQNRGPLVYGELGEASGIDFNDSEGQLQVPSEFSKQTNRWF